MPAGGNGRMDSTLSDSELRPSVGTALPSSTVQLQQPPAPPLADSQDLATTPHSSYLSALRQIDSINVPDLASTLTNLTASRRSFDTVAPSLNDEEGDDDGWTHDFSHQRQRQAPAATSTGSTVRDPQNEWRAQNAASERLRALQEQLRSLQDAHAESREFLDRSLQHLDSIRTPVGTGQALDSLHIGRLRALADMQSMDSASSSSDVARRDRLQRVLARLNRLHGNNATAPSSGSYGETAPSHNSLYDWSPPSMAELDDRPEQDEQDELDSIRRELRRQMPNHHPEVLRVMAESVRTDLDRERQQTRGLQAPGERPFSLHNAPRADQSLRSQAILQAVRRHPRFSARSREFMQRYIADRADRSSSGAAASTASVEPRERYSPTSERYPWNRRPDHNSSTSGDDPRSRLRRSMLSEPPSSAVDTSTDALQRAVVYLGNLRRAHSYEDSLGHAVDARFVTKEFFGHKHDDFVLDIYSLAPVVPTSILARGSKFKGCQRANPDLNPTIGRSRRRWERELGGWETLHSGSSQEYLPRLTLDDPTRPTSSIPPHAQRASASSRYLTPDQWPVEVTIHEVDWERMTLSATMEAQDVPSHTPFTFTSGNDGAATRSDTPSSLPDLINPDGSVYVDSSRSEIPQLPPLSALASFAEAKREPHPLKTITTYLEGEIIDFRTHSFVTENFSSTPANDATYWRKLEPFRSVASDEDLFRRLLSRSFLNELNESYVLMRWKERCFVDDPKATHSSEIRREGQHYETAEGCGLTISGFYYVCMRRSDGHVEGLYCDPQSSPYQHLVLERSVSESWWWGWEFK